MHVQRRSAWEFCSLVTRVDRVLSRHERTTIFMAREVVWLPLEAPTWMWKRSLSPIFLWLMPVTWPPLTPKRPVGPWPRGSVGWSFILYTKSLQVWSLVRSHSWLWVWSPFGARMEGNQLIDFFPLLLIFLSFSLSSPFLLSKINNKKYTQERILKKRPGEVQCHHMPRKRTILQNIPKFLRWLLKRLLYMYLYWPEFG